MNKTHTFLALILVLLYVAVINTVSKCGVISNNEELTFKPEINSSFLLNDHLSIEVIDCSVSLPHNLRTQQKNQTLWDVQFFYSNASLRSISFDRLPDWQSHSSTLPIYLLTRHLII